MKKVITIMLVAVVGYFLFPLLILIGVGWVMSLFSGEEEIDSLISDALDPELDPAWDDRDLNKIYND